MVRVLVLGATGYIGLPTCLTLRRQSHIVYGLARTAAKASFLAQNEIIPVLGSAEDDTEYLRIIREENIDVVLDVAGADDGSFKILEGLIKEGRRRLEVGGGKKAKLGYVYTSGTWVHGSSTQDGKRLNDLNPAGVQNDVDACPLPPPSLVAWRPALEQAVLNASDVLDTLVVRPSLLYGRSSAIWSGWFGQLQTAAETKQSTVELQCDVNAILSLIHVDEVASALVAAVEQISKISATSAYPVFDIVGSREPVEGILEAAGRCLGFRGEVKFVEPKDAFAQAMSTSARLDSTRLRDLLGWEPKRMFGMLDEIEIFVKAWQASP